MTIFKKIKNILKELTSIENISKTDDLKEDIGLDSLGMVTILLKIEDAFGFQLDESDMNPFELTTVNDIIKLVKKYKGNKNAK